MADKVTLMIFDLINLVESELGTTLPQESRHRVAAQFCRLHGGERPYVPHLPKLVAQVQITAIGTAGPQELAVALGKSVRQIRRIQRGR